MSATALSSAGAPAARPFRESDEPLVLELLNHAFGRWPSDIDSVSASEFFNWKHTSGPFGRSVMLVAEEGAAVIGFAAYMPWCFNAGGETVRAVRGVDFAVHSSHRLRGASMALRAAASFPEEVCFNWSNPGASSRRGGVKAGAKEIVGVSHFLQPSRPLMGMTAVAPPPASTNRPEHVLPGTPTAAELLADDAFAEIWPFRAERRAGTLQTVKDLAYLRWRYGLEEYRAVREDARGRAPGLAIFRVRAHGRFTVAEVLEVLVEPGDRAGTRALLAKVRAATRADFLSCSFSSRAEAARCGFLIPSRHRATIAVRMRRSDLAFDPTRREAWALSLGDLDLF